MRMRGPSKEKHQRILAAATAVFLERGFEGANTDDIASAAGVAKQTIFNHFGDKASLFRAICSALTDQVTADLVPVGGPTVGLREFLQRLGANYLDLVLQPNSLALHRIIISEIARFPELGRAVYSASAERSNKMLAHWLAQRAAEGKLLVEHPESAAEHFFALMRGNRQIRCILGLSSEPDGASRDDVVRRGIDAFLRAYVSKHA
jgi:AcrR family transcriptional regulator